VWAAGHPFSQPLVTSLLIGRSPEEGSRVSAHFHVTEHTSTIQKEVAGGSPARAGPALRPPDVLKVRFERPGGCGGGVERLARAESRNATGADGKAMVASVTYRTMGLGRQRSVTVAPSLASAQSPHFGPGHLWVGCAAASPGGLSRGGM
jgi:hypothetical protein